MGLIMEADCQKPRVLSLEVYGMIIRVYPRSTLGRIDAPQWLRHNDPMMTENVQKLAEQVKVLPEEERDEFLSWLAEFELEHADEWDNEIERDSQPGGRLDPTLKRVREDIAAERVEPLDRVINNS